jgi:hypothetical protein
MKPPENNSSLWGCTCKVSMSTKTLKATALCRSFSCSDMAHTCDTVKCTGTDDTNSTRKFIAFVAISLSVKT